MLPPHRHATVAVLSAAGVPPRTGYRGRRGSPSWSTVLRRYAITPSLQAVGQCQRPATQRLEEPPLRPNLPPHRRRTVAALSAPVLTAQAAEDKRGTQLDHRTRRYALRALGCGTVSTTGVRLEDDGLTGTTYTHTTSSPAPPISTPSVQPTPTAKQAHGPTYVSTATQPLIRLRPPPYTHSYACSHGHTHACPRPHPLRLQLRPHPPVHLHPHPHPLIRLRPRSHPPAHLQPRPVNPAIPAPLLRSTRPPHRRQRLPPFLCRC